MGYYIEVPENLNKARQLEEIYGAHLLAACPRSYDDIPKDIALICVVNNVAFEAAGYCYSPEEFAAFKSHDGRGREVNGILGGL